MPDINTQELIVVENKIFSQEKEYAKTYDLKDVEIFAAGTWNGDTYTEKDLDEMVQSFNEIGSKIKPYVKLGHSKDQNILQADGLPAAGWIKNLKRIGIKLVCDMINIPEKIYTLIQNKAYGRFSSEIFWNLKSEGKNYSRVLKAVALLGADTPEVQTLNDFIALYNIDNNENEFESIKQYHDIKLYKETEIMDEKVIQEILAKLEELQKQIDEMKGGAEKPAEEDMKCGDKGALEEKKKLMSKIEELEGQIKKVEFEKKQSEVHSYLDKKREGGFITPAQYDHFAALCMSDTEVKKYTSKDKNVFEGTSFDMVKQIVEGSRQIDFSVQTEASSVDKKVYSNDNNREDDLDKKIKEYSKKNNVSYAEAYGAIAKGE